MSSHIGFKLNANEAAMLIKLATKGKKEKMECMDFCSLVYSDDLFNDVLNCGIRKQGLTKDAFD